MIKTSQMLGGHQKRGRPCFSLLGLCGCRALWLFPQLPFTGWTLGCINIYPNIATRHGICMVEKLAQFFACKFAIPQYLANQSFADRFPAINWDNSPATVRVPKEKVTAFGSNDLEPQAS